MENKASNCHQVMVLRPSFHLFVPQAEAIKEPGGIPGFLDSVAWLVTHFVSFRLTSDMIMYICPLVAVSPSVHPPPAPAPASAPVPPAPAYHRKKLTQFACPPSRAVESALWKKYLTSNTIYHEENVMALGHNINGLFFGNSQQLLFIIVSIKLWREGITIYNIYYVF